MSIDQQYARFVGLRDNPAYRDLENEWLAQVTKIEEARSKAAKTGGESAWRFHAGREEGFKLAMTALLRAIQKIESELEETPQNIVDKLMEEVRNEAP